MLGGSPGRWPASTSDALAIVLAHRLYILFTYSPITMAVTLEPSAHDEVNLGRLVRRLEKSTANTVWQETDRPETWIKCLGTLEVRVCLFALSDRCADLTSSESQVCASTTEDHRAGQYRPDAVSHATPYIYTSLTLTRRQNQSYDAMKVALDRVEAFMQDVEKVCLPLYYAQPPSLTPFSPEIRPPTTTTGTSPRLAPSTTTASP